MEIGLPANPVAQRIAWESSDLSKFSPASAPLILAQQTGSSISSDSGGLSSGASAGIGVGVTILVLGLVGLFVFLLYARKQRRKRVRQESESSEHSTQGYQRDSKTPLSPPPDYYAPKVAASSVEPVYREESHSLTDNRPKSPKEFIELDASANVSELDVSRSSAYFPLAELDSSAVYEAPHRNSIRNPRASRTSELAADVGFTPTPITESSSGHRREASNTSSSAFSPVIRDDGSIGSGNLQGRWADQNYHS